MKNSLIVSALAKNSGIWPLKFKDFFNNEDKQMKFTKTAFRAALKANDQTEIWHLTAVKFGRTPTRNEVYDLIREGASTIRDERKAYSMSYNSQRKQHNEAAEIMAWYKRGAYGQYGDSHYRAEALIMLRRLLTEDHGNYTKVPMMGHTHLYFCSQSYGHADYNKVRTCSIEGNEEFVNKIVKIGEKFMAKHNI